MLTKTSDKHKQIEEVINYLAANNHGEVTPQMVVEEARNPDSPLHSEFEWDIEAAAEKYWIEQARKIIRSVRITYRVEKSQYSTIGYVRDPDKDKKQAGYVSVKKVRSDKQRAHDIVTSELFRARNALERADSLSHYFKIKEDILKIIKMIDNITIRL